MVLWREHSLPTDVATDDSGNRRYMWVAFVVGSRP